MVEKLDGFDLQGDGGGGENIEGIDDDTLDWLRSLFEINDDESNDIVRQTNQIIRETPKISNEENEMARKLLQLNNPLGLLLSPPPYWMDSVTNPNLARTIEAGVFHESSNQSMDSSDFAQQLMSYRLRASNFAASFIKIGEWQRASRNEGDLVAKFYFVKKKLVWEFLQGPIKYKIEIPWSDIIGINAVMEKNQPGMLRIELNQPPTFHEEINPQPRRHTMWKLVKDFTGMQASIFRLHHLTFPCEYLDKHYQKLLLCEPRFFDLSKQSFPTLKNPFFHSNSHGNPGFAFDHNQGGQDSNLRSQFNFPNFPSHARQTQHFQPYENIGKTQHVQPYGHNGQAQHSQPYRHKVLSSLKEMHSPASDSYNVLENQRMSYWDQGMSIYTDALARNHGPVPFVQSTQVHPAATFQNYSLANLVQEAVMNNNALLGDIQAGNYHEKYRMEMIESLSKMVNLHKEVNPESTIASQETYEQQKFTRMPQIHPANPPMPQQRNNFPYDPVNYPNPTVDEFGNINNFKNIWS
ncbi:F10A16.6 PROTEIN [Salix viminalis]|uniref:F10A16.6 PROTEIN n=1 Tax=Salix viminalis TaxID=40686 RepID=A0A9Q0UWM0_SALVM|nr:F10A16.6 PROTEIN [Salix viminalis]